MYSIGFTCMQAVAVSLGIASQAILTCYSLRGQGSVTREVFPRWEFQGLQAIWNTDWANSSCC